MLRLRYPTILALGACLAGLACGGKVPDTQLGPDGGAQLGPPPTCGAICAHVIGSCVAGANTEDCVSYCEQTREKFVTNCSASLDAFLRCMASAKVLCTPGHVEIVDCSDERNSLDACMP